MASCVTNIRAKNYRNLVFSGIFKLQSKMSGMFFGDTV